MTGESSPLDCRYLAQTRKKTRLLIRNQKAQTHWAKRWEYRNLTAHPTLLEAGSCAADFSHFQARNNLLSLLNHIDLKRGIQIRVIAMGVKAAGMRRLMFLTCSLV